MKHWYQSKTIWANVFTILTGVAAGISTLLPTLAPVIDPSTMPWVMFGVGVMNIGLRLITTEGLHVKLDND